MKVVCCWMLAIGKYGFPPAPDDVFRALDDMMRLGFENIELEGIGYANLAAVVENIDSIALAVKERGLNVADFAVLLPEIISMDSGTRARAMDAFARGVEAAAKVESDFVWIDSYFPPLKLENGALSTDALVYGQQLRVRIDPAFSWPAFWDSYVAAIGQCADIVRAHGMKLLIEPRVGEVIANADAMIRLADAVGSDRVGFILDTAHQHAQKEILPLVVEKMGPLIEYVHIADNDGRDNRHFEPGNGTIDWEQLFVALKKHAYDGYFAVDLENMPNLEEKFAYTRRFLREKAALHEL